MFDATCHVAGHPDTLAPMAPRLAPGDTPRTVPIAVRIEDSIEVVYASSHVEIGRRPSSDVVLTDSSLFNVRPRWIVQDGDRLWLRSTRDESSSVELPATPPEPLGSAGVRVEGVWVKARLCEPVATSDLGEAEASARTTSPERLVDLALCGVELARLVAANVSSPARLLTQLGQGFDRLTLAAVTANPSTPPATLYHLGPLFPEAFWANPQLSLLMLQDPVLSPLSAYRLALLVSHPSAPLDTLRLFASHPNAPVREFSERALRTRGA